MSKNGLIALVVFAAVVVFIFARRAQKTKEAKEAGVATIAVEKPAKGKHVKINLSAKAGDNQVLRTNAVMGYVNVPVSTSRKGVQVDVQFETREQCNPGDINVIEHDLKIATQQRLLLTVESIGGGGGIFTKHVAMDELKHGFRETIDVPDSSDPKPLGVYICLDSKGEGSCAHKPAADMSMQSVKDAGGMEYAGSGAKDHASDRLYFFEHLQVQKGTMQVLGTTTPKESQYADLAAHFHDSMGKDGDAAVEAIRLANQKVSSMPPEVNKKGIKFVLPYGTQSHCKMPANQFPTKMDVVTNAPTQPPKGAGEGPVPKVWSMPAKDRGFTFAPIKP